jgi:molybdate-binding protein
MADVGFGLEPPARQFHLDFVPLANERYFLLGHAAVVESAAVQVALAALRGGELRAALNALPGYDASGAGAVTALKDAFPSLARLHG